MLLIQQIPDILLSLMAIRFLSQLSPLYTTATRVSQRSLSAFLAVGRGKSKTTELFKSRDDGDDEANSPFSGARSLARSSIDQSCDFSYQHEARGQRFNFFLELSA